MTNHPLKSEPEAVEPDNGESTPLSQLLPTPAPPVNLVQLKPAIPELEISDRSSPLELVAWGLKYFATSKIVMTSSFGMEGCALMDMASKAVEQHDLEPLTIASIDTGFFFPETQQLQRKLIERYPNLNFVTWETEVSIAEQAETYGPNLWKNNPNMCCHIRKVVPMQENVINYDIWITGLRRSQTQERAAIPVIGWDWRYQVMKFCPLATWTRPMVWKYIQENDVPFNQLHLQNYPTVSCYHCTSRVEGAGPDSDVRSGRWEGKEKNECGLHFNI